MVCEIDFILLVSLAFLNCIAEREQTTYYTYSYIASSSQWIWWDTSPHRFATFMRRGSFILIRTDKFHNWIFHKIQVRIKFLYCEKGNLQAYKYVNAKELNEFERIFWFLFVFACWCEYSIICTYICRPSPQAWLESSSYTISLDMGL